MPSENGYFYIFIMHFYPCFWFHVFQVKLDSFLEMPDVLLLPQVNLLQSNAHRSTVQKRSFNVIIAIYKQIYGLLTKDGPVVHSNANQFYIFFCHSHFDRLQNEFTIQTVI